MDFALGGCGNERFVPSRLRIEKEANRRCQIKHQWIEGTTVCSEVKGNNGNKISQKKVDKRRGMMMTAFYDKGQT